MVVSLDAMETGLGRPMQLIRRDRFGATIDEIDIFGPDYGEQGVTLLEGYSGMYHATRTVNRESWSHQEGSYPSPFPRVEERMVEFTLGTQAETPAAWERIENRLWRFLKSDTDCYLRAHSELSEPRELRIRLDRPPGDLLGGRLGPGLNRFGVWKIVAFAWDPWWYSETLKATVKRSEMTQVATGVWEKNVPVRNPADQQCWLQFSSNELAATTTVSLPDHLSGRMVTLPPLGVGKSFLVQTYPLAETLMVMDDSQEWGNMDARAFGDVGLPAGMVNEAQIPIRIVGGTPDTEVSVYMVQKWERMFGGESEFSEDAVPVSVPVAFPSPGLYPGAGVYPQVGEL